MSRCQIFCVHLHIYRKTLKQMKAQHFLLLFIGLSLVCGAQNTIDKQGRKQGHWIKTDKQGHKIFEGNFKDGHETGVFEYFYADGTVRLRNTFVGNDGKRCKHEAYDEKGRLVAKGEYCLKNRDGRWEYYAEDGKMIKLANYKMGVKEGMQAIFEHSGDTAEVLNWKDNKKDGRWWKRTGKKAYLTATYKDGALDGRLTEYNENGQLAHECTYSHGSKDGHSIYYENGLKTIDESWQKGIFIDRTVLILEGKTAHYKSIYKIAYVMPVGQNQKKTIVYMTDGSKVTATENSDDICARLGDELFSVVNKKNRVVASTQCIKGIKKDAEGRDILDLDPVPSFVIFPDEDCIKLVQAMMNQKNGVVPGE